VTENQREVTSNPIAERTESRRNCFGVLQRLTRPQVEVPSDGVIDSLSADLLPLVDPAFQKAQKPSPAQPRRAWLSAFPGTLEVSRVPERPIGSGHLRLCQTVA
jgi:hypothetical protein